MNLKRTNKAWLCAALIGAATSVFAGTPDPLSLAPESAVWLVGDSTLHPFTSRTSELKLAADVDGATPGNRPEALLKGALKQMELTIPVQSLKSKEATLDKNMYKALKTASFPEIVFRLDKYDIVPSTSSASVSQITASGTLRIAGVEKPIVLQLTAEPATGALHAQGQYTLLMTDYGIKPPTMMMGTIKVKDPVVIHFELHLR